MENVVKLYKQEFTKNDMQSANKYLKLFPCHP